MQNRRSLSNQRSSKQLLKTLTGNPALPAFIRTLQTPVLHSLIERVGVRDAGQLIALTTPEQLRGVFDVTLWETLIPGETERLRPEKFMEWLDVMLEVGAGFTAERLIELGDAFVVMNLAPLIHILDREVAVEHQEEPPCFCLYCELIERDVPFEAFDEYIVTPVHEDEWDAVRTVLVELDGEDADFLRRVLWRCSPKPTARGFADDSQPLLEDETHEREQRRSRGGFVTPPLAAAFLKTARTSTLDELTAQSDYDDVSQRYFDQLAAAAAASALERERATAEASDQDGVAPITSMQLRALENVLVEAQIVAERQPLLLSGPTAAQSVALELQGRLDRLRFTRPDAFAARLGELVYLANLLMAGSAYQGGRFTETEAARATLACANLGLDHLLNAYDDAHERADIADDLLERPPGLIRLFRIGWNLIQALPLRCAVGLLEALRSEHVREQLSRRRWILDEIESAVNDPDIIELIEQGEFDDVGDNLVLLTLVLDARACQCLRTLIVDFPRYPIQLDLGFGRPEVATAESRYVTTLRQLQRVDDFVRDLDGVLRV